MKLALLGARLPPANDGVGDHADRLARALARRGHDVTVLTAGEAAPSSEYRLEICGGRWDAAAALRAQLVLARMRPDALAVEYTPFLYGASSAAPLALLLTARALGIRTAVLVHEALYPRTGDGVASRVKASALVARDILTLRSADAAIVPGESRRTALALRVPSLRDRLHVVPIGANIEPAPGVVRAATAPATIVSFGVVMPRRRLECVVTALANLVAAGCDARVEVIGRVYDVAYADRIVQQARAAGVGRRWTFSGELSPAAVSLALARASAAVHATREGSIASSGSLLALLAHGVPTVAVRTPFDDTVFNGAVRYVEDDDRAIAAALRSLVAEPEVAETLSRGAVARYGAQCSWDRIAIATTALLTGEAENARLAAA